MQGIERFFDFRRALRQWIRDMGIISVMHDVEKAIAEAAAHPTFTFTTVGEPTITPPRQRPNPAVVAELARAIDHFRWCWDCGTADEDCRATTAPAGKCCPDCRHRDTGASYLAPLFDGYAR